MFSVLLFSNFLYFFSMSLQWTAWLIFYTLLARYTVFASISNIIDHKNYYFDDLL